MRVKKRGIQLFLICLCLMLTLTVPAFGEAQADDPVVVRVGKISYPLSVVQLSLDSALDVAGRM